MKKKTTIIFCATLIFFATNICFAFTEPAYLPVSKPVPTTIKTVGSTGCDYRTLDEASMSAKPGWLIKIKAGTYGSFTWTAAGTSGNEIVIEPYGDGPVYFKPNNQDGTYIINTSYVIFDGGSQRELIWDGININSGRYNIVLGFDVASSPHHITLSRIQSLNNQDNAAVYSSSVNIRASGNYNRIYNSLVKDSNGAGVYVCHGNGFEIKNNIFTSNGGAGVQVNPHMAGEVVDNLVIDGNIVYENGIEACSYAYCYAGITILSGTNKLYNVWVTNNKIWGNQTAGIKKENACSNANVRIHNNTVYKNIESGFWFKSDGTMSIVNNIVSENGNDSYQNWADQVFGPNSASASCNLLSTPNFKSTLVSNPDYLDLDLTATNAIGKGIDMSSTGLSKDLYGTSRITNTPYDIGANEYIQNSSGNNSSLQNITSLQVVSQTP